MSFDVYVEWFRDGEPAWVPTDDVRHAFGEALVSEDDLGWRLSFGPDLESDVYLSFHDNDASRVSSLSVNRPSSADAMWTSLFALLGMGNSVFYFPGGGVFARSPNVGRHVPREMVEALGEPQVVAQPQDLVDAIAAS